MARCTLCDNVRQWLAAGQWFSPGTSVSSTNKTDRHDITEILLNVALNTIKQTNKHSKLFFRVVGQNTTVTSSGAGNVYPSVVSIKLTVTI
jgi:hypothetical protein